VRNVQRLIVSVLKIGKQRLHTATASGGQTHYRVWPRAPLLAFRPPDILGYNPQMKISGATKEWT